ncbi:23026_t:CDS:2, partial [Entrophospora sp. SA101]
QIISKIGKDPKLIATIYQFTETLKKKGVDLTTDTLPPKTFNLSGSIITKSSKKSKIKETLKSILDQSPQPTSRSINSIEHLRSNVKNSKIKETLKSILDQSPQPTSQSINQVEHLRSNVKKSKIKEALKSILDQSPQPNFQSIKPIEHLRSNVNASANSTEIIPKTIINHIQVTDTSIKPVINAPSTVPDTITSTSAKKSMRIRRRIAATTNAKQKIKSSRKSKKSIGLFSKIKGFFGLSN